MKTAIRDHHWLDVRLSEIWEEAFADVPRINDIVIRFGRKSATRLGSIRRRGRQTQITITGYFRDPAIPQAVIDETIAHELVHYSHGFESSLPRLYRYPHEGGIVRCDLIARGLGTTHRAARRWLRDHWRGYLARARRMG